MTDARVLVPFLDLGATYHELRGEIDAAYQKAYRILRARIEALLALPLKMLEDDKAALKAELDRIATITA